jgi:surface polysaccharide O-acyltransferase-like enzyme
MSPSVEAVRKQTHEAWVDNLRVLLIAGVIVVHTATAYVVDIPWYYEEERVASGVWAIVIGLPALLGGAFGLGPLFFVAGMFSVRSLAHRGPAGFARARLVRLGLPLLVFAVLIQPLTDWVGNLRDERGSFLYYLGITEVSVMWFVAALLVCSLLYAGLRHLHPARPVVGPVPVPRLLAIAAATIAVTSLAVWQVWPWNAEVVLNLRAGEWPQGAVLFALGVYAGETGWAQQLSPGAVRRLGWVAAAGAAAFSALLGLEVLVRGDIDVLLEAQAPLDTAVMAVLDGVLAVAWTVWCVAWFQRRWDRHGPLIAKAGRASYATYILHPLVLTTLMVLFALVALGPALKFLVLSLVAVPTCFLIGYAVTRLPGVSRVL